MFHLVHNQSNLFVCFVLQKFGERLGPLQRSIEDLNDHVASFRSGNVNISPALLARVDDLNAR